MAVQPEIDPTWRKLLENEFQAPYFKELKEQLVKKIDAGETIYPPPSQIFSAFNITPVDSVKVVILGQDPYHGPGQAHGLAFSVQDGVKPPPSLVNMFKEIQDDIGGKIPDNGNLTRWAEQGVFLLNAILTVTAKKPASHHDLGRQQFTDAVIQQLSDNKKGLIFMLWGNFAQSKETLIDSSKHVILKATHPSPFSAHKGFFGCKHFSTCNQILQMQGKEPIQRLEA